jgi:hypothetical protein
MQRAGRSGLIHGSFPKAGRLDTDARDSNPKIAGLAISRNNAILPETGRYGNAGPTTNGGLPGEVAQS